MLALILALFVSQVPCAQGELSVVCNCKQGKVSACEALRVTDPKLADALESAWVAAQLEEKAARAAQQAQADAASSAPEPPDCKGQEHHIISRPIAKALESHRTLRGLYKPRDPRFVTQAKDEPAHCGYQQWHRDVDREVIAWLDDMPNATPEQFVRFLRDIYSRPAMRARFPHGF